MNGRVHPLMSDARRGASPALARVLVVEDDPDLRRLAELVLASQGHDVGAARDAGIALGMLEAQTYDLLFSDVVMPGAMDGTALAREAARRWPCMRILLSSGHLDDAAPDTGRWRLLPKPDTPAALLRAVARALEDQGASEA